MKKESRKFIKFFCQRDVKKGFKFIAVFTPIFFFLYLTVPFYIQLIELVYAQIVTAWLNFSGVKAFIISSTEPVQIIMPGIAIQISFLCTGLIELFVLVAAILASSGIEWKKRFYGLIGAFDAVVLFNLTRILLTLNLVQNNNQEITDFAHNFFFRVFLFIVIVGFYSLWFYWATEGQALRKLKQ